MTLDKSRQCVLLLAGRFISGQTGWRSAAEGVFWLSSDKLGWAARSQRLQIAASARDCCRAVLLVKSRHKATAALQLGGWAVTTPRCAELRLVRSHIALAVGA